MNEFGMLLDDIKEVKSDVKEILSFCAVTEERLNNGNKRFEDHEVRIRTIEIEPRVHAQEEVKETKTKIWDIKLVVYGAVIGLVVFLAEKFL